MGQVPGAIGATAPTEKLFAQAAQRVLRTASVRHDAPNGLAELARAIEPQSLSLVLLYCSADADAAAIARDAQTAFAPAPVIGCTTAGEIAEMGYTEGRIVAIGLPSADFATRTTLIEGLQAFDSQTLVGDMIRTRDRLARDHPDWPHEFDMLLVDGLSTREDALVSALALGLGPVPLFGGSAGDGTRFEKTWIIHEGRIHRDAAVLTQVRTRCPVKVFKTDHLTPTNQRMVVTGADPARRIVHEINAEPAAREYARILGKDPEQLTTFTFAAYPVVVRIGGQHHVRAIQQVTDAGELIFFSAIDEGLVLTLAEPRHMAEHLAEELSALDENGPPADIIACDCILRRMEAQEKQMTSAISALLQQHGVTGFSTYGEQFNSMHVNQTLTGVAIYPPAPDVTPATTEAAQ